MVGYLKQEGFVFSKYHAVYKNYLFIVSPTYSPNSVYARQTFWIITTIIGKSQQLRRIVKSIHAQNSYNHLTILPI